MKEEPHIKKLIFFAIKISFFAPPFKEEKFNQIPRVINLTPTNTFTFVLSYITPPVNIDLFKIFNTIPKSNMQVPCQIAIFYIFNDINKLGFAFVN